MSNLDRLRQHLESLDQQTRPLAEVIRDLDAFHAEHRDDLPPRLAHFLERRSYAKARAFLHGEVEKIPTDGGADLAANPFAALNREGLPDAPKRSAPTQPVANKSAPLKRGRVDLQRQKGGRGGKVVTIISGAGMNTTGPQDLEAMLAHFKKRLGCGGKIAGKTVELQGDVRDAVEPELTARGYRVVRVGG